MLFRYRLLNRRFLDTAAAHRHRFVRQFLPVPLPPTLPLPLRVLDGDEVRALEIVIPELIVKRSTLYSVLLDDVGQQKIEIFSSLPTYPRHHR